MIQIPEVMYLHGSFRFEKMALPPCHCHFNLMSQMANFLVNYTKEVQIFSDWPLNNFLFFFIHMIANLTNLKVGDFVHTIGDAHLYLNHETSD